MVDAAGGDAERRGFSGVEVSSEGALRFRDFSFARRALRSSAAAPRVV